MTPLARTSPTLAAYGPLDCGLLRIGSRWIVFIEDRLHDETTYATRLEAIDALYQHAVPPPQRAVEAHEAGVRG